MERRKAPQAIFDGFDGATEEEKGALRTRAIEWLEAQPKKRGCIYVIPDPETGAEVEMEWGKLQ